jgi:predicted thioesterase
MKNPFVPGDVKTYRHTVTQADFARLPGGLVHEVYSTFALARDAEWASRLFVLDMREGDEEGIGTAVQVTHHSPALVGETVDFVSTLAAVERNEIITPFEAKVGSRVIATGETRQKILKREKLERLFASLKS